MCCRNFLKIGNYRYDCWKKTRGLSRTCFQVRAGKREIKKTSGGKTGIYGKSARWRFHVLSTIYLLIIISSTDINRIFVGMHWVWNFPKSFWNFGRENGKTGNFGKTGKRERPLFLITPLDRSSGFDFQWSIKNKEHSYNSTGGESISVQELLAPKLTINEIYSQLSSRG